MAESVLYHRPTYQRRRYRPSEIFVTENGVDVPGENSMSMEQALNDQFRINYFRTYLDNAAKAAASDGVPLTKYFAWSLLDNFEWVCPQ
jgi:beta-glucosidase